MTGMSIGQVARICGISPSAIRYYERAGLLPKAARVSRQRRYDAQAVGRLRILQLAREAGFTIAETRILLTGFSATTPPAKRWQILAERKLAEIAAQITRLERMQALLASQFNCHCPTLEDCARAISSRPASPSPP